MAPIRVAILTVSDTAFADATADRSGPVIQDIITSHHGEVESDKHYRIVPDTVEAIQSVVKEWADNGNVDWIITTGGTGFGVRDATPEAITPLLNRPAPGLVHLLLSASLQHTPLAALSRPVAGVIKSTLITTLPGSVKAVKENMDALMRGGVVQHAVELLRGGTGARVHAILAGGEQRSMSHNGHRHGHDHGAHVHHHDHHIPIPRSVQVLSHDPSAPASARHRKSPYPLISFEAALSYVHANIEVLPVETRIVDNNLREYILAEDVQAPQDVPPTSTTNVDGYAIRSTDSPGVYKVLTRFSTTPLPEDTIYRINTGSPLPPGTDAVIMVEDTQLVSTDNETEEEAEVETLARIPVGENVRLPGSDVRKGDNVMLSGDRITGRGGEVGSLVFVGREKIRVYRKPVVAILSTGNELTDLHTREAGSTTAVEGWGGIFDTNRPSLRAVLESMGYEIVDLGIVPDDIEAHVKAIQRGLSEADMILTTGGTSMGPTDLLKPVIERNFGGTVHFGRVTVKPGKPTTFATIPFEGEEGRRGKKPIFALPGNPASALVMFYVFVVPALRKMGGWTEEMCQLPRVKVEIQHPMFLDPRTEFHRVVIRIGRDSGVLKAFSTGGQRSSRVASLSGANGFVVLPPSGLTGTKVADVGTVLDAIVIGELEVE
ncbi:hypothetical protein K443DRAFT_3481 [Laccaria amethystina LaAM-08-1]|uniref:MoaB/Mog domain-containing protein n=1 Tax=Laccaria amethystina LaAM-08-1 TaxID=1095629 RepID=A0A0C9YCL0_9AGAR|nr:hypothetical protein K443DRAFT_3481 [Laccaria amethystina LaAM-08-1]